MGRGRGRVPAAAIFPLFAVFLNAIGGGGWMERVEFNRLCLRDKREI